MVPNSTVSTTRPTGAAKLGQNDDPTKNPYFGTPVVWKNVITILLLHLAFAYSVRLLITQANWKTGIYAYNYGWLCSIGVTAGAHRLWTHRAYEAKLPLRILLMIMQTTALQYTIYDWSTFHRVHHKFTDMDADPHNAKRGFFFSHIGWVMLKNHKDVLIKGKTVDLSDVEADPVVRFQKKYYLFLIPVFCVFIPSLVPRYCWGETWWHSLFVSNVFRYVLSLHYTFMINSAAHMFGTKPYDASIQATENSIVAFVAVGEGWHNYHHVFPWDYKAAELGNYTLNITTAFIDLMAKIGWAYNLKTTSPDLIRKYAENKGDGSWKDSGDHTVWRCGKIKI